MDDYSPSQTAIGTARIRAAHQILDDDPKVLDDPIAVGLVPGSQSEDVLANEAQFEAAALRAIRAILVMRSRYVEDLLGDLAEKGLRQYVILGAGLDTFAYRQPAWAQGLTVIEVDHPATQSWKRSVLQERGVSLPRNLEFCPVDFERMSLNDGLQLSSFDRRHAALFSWLGVTQYLTDEAVSSTLRYICSLSRGSSIVFSFVLPDEQLQGEDKELRLFAAEVAASRGEPFLTHFEPQVLRNQLEGMGYSRVVHFTPEAANTRYFANRGDGLQAPGYEHLMWAGT